MVNNDSPLRRFTDLPTANAPQYTDAELAGLKAAEDNPLTRGFDSAIGGMLANRTLGNALEAELAGDTDRHNALLRAGLADQAAAQATGPRVSSLRDVDSVGSALELGMGFMGQGAGSILPTTLAAAATRGRLRAPVALGTAYNLEADEAIGNQYADPVLAEASAEDRINAARAKGILNMGLEAAVPLALVGRTARTGSAVSRVGRTMGIEGATETAQEAVGFGAEKYLDPDRQLDPVRLADAALAGALGGGGVSAVVNTPAAIADAIRKRQQAAPVQGQGPDAEPPMESTPPGVPLLPAPDDGMFDTSNERFDPGLRGQAQKTKDYVSDTIDRMSEAAKTAQTPSDFLRQVFGNSIEDMAAADLRPDTEDPSVLNAADPAAAIQQRDAQRQERAAMFAAELLNDPATPQSVKERVASFGGDFSNSEAQAFVARNLVAQRAGEKLVHAVNDFIDLSKEFGGKAAEVGTDLATKARGMLDESMTAAADRIVKKNLQDTTPTEQAAFNKLVFDSLTDEAKASPAVRQRLPELANAMLAFAARTGDLTKADLKTLSRMQDGLSLFQDPEGLANQLVEYTGVPRTGDSFLSRVKRVTNAQQDILQPNSFLYLSLSEDAKDSLTQPQLRQIARLVDEFTLTDSDKSEGDKVLAGLTAAFGSKESAQAVLDYYQQQNRADVRFDPNETLTGGSLTEREGAPAPTYQFADPKAMRPYRTFAGQTTTEGGMRRRVRESTMAGAALRRSSPDGANVEPISMSQYVRDTGGDAEAEVLRISNDIKKRITEHEKRKGEDRSQQINQLKGELSMMREAYRRGGADATLDLYEVLRVSEQEQNDTLATDEDISKMSRLADAKDARGTRVTFQREDGSKFTLSAESMWKTQGDKEGSGRGENAEKRARRLFADAVAAVMARPEVTKMVTPLGNITIDRKLGITAEKRMNPEYRAMVREALKAAEGSIKKLREVLDNVVDEFLELGDAGAEGEARRNEIQDIIQQNIDQLSERLDQSRNNEGPLAGNIAAQAVARQKLRMYRETQGQIDAIMFDEEFDDRDNNRAGVPGSDDSGPVGRDMPRTRMNEELGNAGPRFAEEDTGLGVGVEKRGPTPTPTAKAGSKQPPKPGNGPAKTGVRSAPSVVRKNSFVGAKADPQGAADAEGLLGSGAPADVVWRELGWFRGPDGKLRKEVRSPVLRRRARELATAIANGTAEPTTIGALLEGLDGFKPYLDKLGDTPVRPDDPMIELIGAIGAYIPDDEGSFSAGIGLSRLNAEVAARMEAIPDGKGPEVLRDIMHRLTLEELRDDGLAFAATGFATTRDVLAELGRMYPLPDVNERVAELLTGTILHELQHAFQHVEGFEGGGNALTAVIAHYGDVDAYLAAVRDRDEGTVERITEQAFEKLRAEVGPDGDMEAAAHELYESIVGEVEANDVAARMKLSDAEAREVAPALMDAERRFVRSITFAEALHTFRSKMRSSAMGARKGRPGKDWGNKEAVKAEILRLRGRDVKVRIAKLVSQLGGSGQYTYDPATGERLIEVAINAKSPLGTARHEAMHDFFRFLGKNDATRSVASDLRDATSAPHVLRQLRELLKDHKAALEQLNDPEERAAYAYQFWAEGKLRIGPTGTGIFHTIRQFIKDMFGIVTTGQRAEDILRAFHDGKFADPSIVQEVLQDLADRDGTTLHDKMERAAPALTKALNAVVQAAPDRLRRFENDSINTLADKFFSETGKQGFIQNKFQQEGVWENKLAGILRGTTAVERREAVEQLQSMRATSPLAKKLRKYNDELYAYMSEAGVKSWDSRTKKFVPLRKAGSYFARSWDPDAIARNREEFISLLMAEGGVSARDAAALADNLARGSEARPRPRESAVDLGFMPYAPHTAERVLTFINAGNAGRFAKFQHKDLADIMTSNLRASVHRAEYARAFGNNGEEIAKLVAASGITDVNELSEISNSVQAMEGSLDPGRWSNETKEFMSGIMTLQNVVLLPMALVSQMIDPIVMAARTGDIRDAGRAYATALTRLKNTITKSNDKAVGEDLAEILGIVSDSSTLQAMSMAYGTTRMSKRMENINRVFFKYNGMQGWNNSMRIAATAAGERYLIANKNNAKVLAELGLTPEDVKVRRNGRLNVSSPKVQQAMFQFVDQAVLRPSAANRPVWMSDPRFLLVAHLKQFTFAMHNVVLKRASRELANGNPKPWGTLMMAMPVILAADMAKFALTGTAPSTWGFTDYLVHAVERSGLLGLGDFGMQAMDGVSRGGMPGEDLLGPTFEHLMEILRWIGGDPRTDFGDVVDRTIPGARFI